MASSRIQRNFIDFGVFHHGLNDYEMHLSNILAFSKLCRCLYISIVGETKLVSSSSEDG